MIQTKHNLRLHYAQKKVGGGAQNRKN
jgi:hypothetical protein